MILKPVEASLFDTLKPDIKKMLKQSGVVSIADPFVSLWNLPPKINTAVLIGGRGGMKTYGISDFVAHQAAVNKKRCVVLRDEKSLIKASILNEILSRFDDIPFNTKTTKLHTGLRDQVTGKDVLFTMGFRASDNTKKANLKGLSDIDIAVIEEAEDIIDPDKFNTFVDSLRKEGCLVIIILNTPDVGHFIIKTFFNTQPAPVPDNIPEQYIKDFEGYFEIVPKKSLEDTIVIQTNYTDNKWLTPAIIKRYKSYGDPKSHLYNPHYYMTAIKGYSSSGRKGQILKKVKLITMAEYKALPYREHYAQDFGTASPAGLVGYKIHKNKSWARQINYLPMETLDIGKLYCKLGLNVADEITADSADENAWKTLRNGFLRQNLSDEDIRLYPKLLVGWNVSPCKKGKDSINYGLDDMISMELYVVDESKDFWEEIRNYVYNQDKYGNYTNDPIDDFNHLIDPWRYGVNRHRGKQYAGSVSV